MNRRKKYTIEEVKKFAKEKGGECLSTEYINNKTNLTWKCNKCKHIWETNFKAVKIQNNWCPNCAGRPKRSISDAKKLAKERGGKCLSTEYINNKTNLLWKCGKCNYIWKARFDRVKNGTWCPKCKISRGERAISSFLNKRKIDHIVQYYTKDLGKRRYDFFLPNHNLIIEFDGIQHFKVYKLYAPTQEIVEKIQQHDLIKTKYCLTNNIRLLRISYDNLNYVNDILPRVLNCEDKLIFTSKKLYKYLSEKISAKAEIIDFATGVGEQ
jgi:very-short-patch-repair endonuclease